jgi:hypothetical protein
MISTDISSSGSSENKQKQGEKNQTGRTLERFAKGPKI